MQQSGNGYLGAEIMHLLSPSSGWIMADVTRRRELAEISLWQRLQTGLVGRTLREGGQGPYRQVG